jgi:hypothetical protein
MAENNQSTKNLTATMSVNTEIGKLTVLLQQVLIPYITLEPDDRDRLIETYGSVLLKLDSLLHTLTRSRVEREQLIIAQQMFLEIEKHLEAMTSSEQFKIQNPSSFDTSPTLPYN